MNTMDNPNTSSESVDPGMIMTGQQITAYLDDKPKEHGELPGRVVPDQVVIASGSEPRRHTLEDILARPYVVATNTWSSADLPNANLSTTVFPDALFQRPIVANKLNNFLLFRADVCVRIVVNTTPFMAGKLLCYFSPLGTVVGQRSVLNDHLPAKTAFPHAILDAGVGNVVELRIPYVNPYNHYRLTNDVNEMGTLYVDVFNALRSAAASSVTVTVFAWFENIDVGVPTALPLVVPTLRAQAGEAVVKTRQGVLSDVTSKFASFSRSAEGLPIVGKAFPALTWMSDAATRTLSGLGLCKPSSVQTVAKYVNIPSNAYTNGEGVDEGTVLAVMPSNLLQERNDVFGSEIDEMDIKYVASRMCLLRQFEWTNSTPVGSLSSWFVSPVKMDAKSVTVSSVVYPYYEPHVLGYLSLAFDLWRGSLKYKVQVAKTAYHSGRLRIAYVPGGLESVAGSYNLDLCYNWILDLRTSNEIEFEIPFTSVTPWLKCSIPVEGSGEANVLRTTGGILVVSVLNPLVSPNTVSGTVDVNVWVSGGHDFELARPVLNKFKPIDISNADPPALRVQAGEQQQSRGFNDFVPAAHMFDMTPANSVSLDAMTVGEAVRSLRTLIKRFGIKWFGNLRVANNRLEIPNSFGIAPFIEAQPTSQLMTPLEYLSYLYRFYRGSFNFKAFVRSRTFNYTSGSLSLSVGESAQIRSVNELVTSPAFDIVLTESAIDFGPTYGGAFTHTTFTDVNPTHEVNVPFYTGTGVLPIYGNGIATSGGIITDVPATNYNTLYLDYESSATQTPNSGESRARLEIWQAGGDDMQFGWLVGPPRIARSAAVTTDSFIPATPP